ncbi:MAG: hypothetical protein ACO3EL_07700 [Burkholderiaceae bacterium]
MQGPTPEERIARARARRLSKENSKKYNSFNEAESHIENSRSRPEGKSNNFNVLQFTGLLGALLVLLSWIGAVSYQVGWIGFAVGAASAVYLNK